MTASPQWNGNALVGTNYMTMIHSHGHTGLNINVIIDVIPVD